LAGSVASFAADVPGAVTIDYAYYNPVSLLLKKKGWLETELGKDSVGVRWVLSLGSNKALENGLRAFVEDVEAIAPVGHPHDIAHRAVPVAEARQCLVS
jgi:hypothetical protein